MRNYEERKSKFLQNLWQLFCQFPLELQTQTVRTEKLEKRLLNEKAAHKMLVKLTPAKVATNSWDYVKYSKIYKRSQILSL